MPRLDGLLLVDKPFGWTSHDVVKEVRKILGQKAVGHSGTLDPIASGLLVLLLGQATKLSNFLRDGHKTYRAKIRLGLETDTLDASGEVLQRKPVENVDPEVVKDVLEKATGVLELPVPVFSAVKVQGQKLYNKARNKEPVEPPLRAMEFENLQIEAIGDDYVWATMTCSKGSYLRAWAAHVGKQLGTGGVLEELRRLHSEPYSVEQALSLEALRSQQESSEAFIPLLEALPDRKIVSVDGKDEKLMRNGQISHGVSRRLLGEQKMAIREQKPVGIKVRSASTGRLLSLLEARPSEGLRVQRIFPPA